MDYTKQKTQFAFLKNENFVLKKGFLPSLKRIYSFNLHKQSYEHFYGI